MDSRVGTWAGDWITGTNSCLAVRRWDLAAAGTGGVA